ALRVVDRSECGEGKILRARCDKKCLCGCQRRFGENVAGMMTTSMKKIIQVGLGVVTGIGGFLEIGSVTTSAQAGAAFSYQLIWALVLGILCLSFLVEMSGRFAAVSKHTVVDGLRDRFGFGFFSVV